MDRKLQHKHSNRPNIWHSIIVTIIAVCLLMLPLNTYADTEQSVAEAQYNLDYWPNEIAKFETMYAKNPKDQNVIAALSNAYNNYGVVLANNKRWREAASFIEQAISLGYNTEPMRKNLSNVYYAQSKELYDSKNDLSTYNSYNAIALVNKAISIDPNNVNAYLLLGDIEYMEQNMFAAQRAWQKAASLVPENQAVQKRLAQINRETNAETDMNAVFNARFNIKIDTSVAANPNFNINEILNKTYDKVAPDFQYVQHQKIPVVVYNKQEYKETMVDAPGWAEAAYDNKIRLAIDPNQKDFRQLQSDIIHEYTHVIISKLTNNNCPRWFNEGIAKYEEYKHGVPPRIYLLAIAYNTDEIIDWSNINSAIVNPNKEIALLAYQQSFSFIYFLVQQYGMQKIVNTLKLLGKKTDFNQAILQTYGQNINVLQKNWRLWLTEFITHWANVPATSGVDYD